MTTDTNQQRSTDGVRLLELAERCEVAAGPDRVLDYEIARALNIVALPPDPIEKVTRGWHESVHYLGGGVSQGKEARAYTASLDAAMTLAGATARHVEWCDGYVEACCFSFDEYDSACYTAKAATPALALCAAALRARAAGGRNDL